MDLILASQSVCEPRADAWPSGELRTRLEKSDGRIMIDRLGIHRFDETDVVLTRRSPNPPRASSDRERESDGNGSNLPTIFA